MGQQLDQLPDWQLGDDALRVAYRFESSATALEFIATVGLEAEKINHHPDMIWRRETVQVEIVFSSLKKVADQDLQLAARIGSSADAVDGIPIDLE